LAFWKIQNGGPTMTTRMEKAFEKMHNNVNKCARCDVTEV